MIFLENPEIVDEKGGYVPGGLLLWGPPGTGKTLMAEAVAGETGKPYVFVDPGAFIQMFMGVGILKVKSLFRKLRRLALRYGGVIVFFDEADSLGNRGQLPQGGGLGGPGRATPAPFAHAGCHGFSYLSDDTQWRLVREAMATDGPDEPDTRRNKQMIGGMMNGGGGGQAQQVAFGEDASRAGGVVVVDDYDRADPALFHAPGRTGDGLRGHGGHHGGGHHVLDTARHDRVPPFGHHVSASPSDLAGGKAIRT
jgi:hypothetical protein